MSIHLMTLNFYSACIRTVDLALHLEAEAAGGVEEETEEIEEAGEEDSTLTAHEHSGDCGTG